MEALITISTTFEVPQNDITLMVTQIYTTLSSQIRISEVLTSQKLIFHLLNESVQLAVLVLSSYMNIVLP